MTEDSIDTYEKQHLSNLKENTAACIGAGNIVCLKLLLSVDMNKTLSPKNRNGDRVVAESLG